MKLPVLFRDMPIRSKLTFITVLSAGTALLFAALIIMVYQWFLFRAGLEKTTHLQAHIVASNSTSALVLNDPAAASQTMEALGALANIEFAVLYDKQGKPFATFVAAGQKSQPSYDFPEVEPTHESRTYSDSDSENLHTHAEHVFTATHLDVIHEIDVGDEQIGTVYMRSNLAPIYQKMVWSAAAVTAAGLAGLGLALLLIATLHPAITGPMATLIGLMDRISSEKNYALRAESQGKDEVAILGREFNAMLAQIQARDTTLAQHRAHLEQEVAQRTASFNEAQHIAHLGSWEWDIVNDTLIWSDEIYRIFGLAPQQFEATYDAFMQFVHPDDRPDVEERVRQALEQGQYSLDHRIQLPDGSVRHVHEQGKVSLGEDGRATRMVGTVQDITEYKQMELRTLESEKRFRSLAESTSDWIWQVDEYGTYVYSSPKVNDLLGYEPDEVLGKTPFDFMLPEEAARVGEIFKNIVSDQRTFSFLENVNLHKDGHKVILETSGVPLVSGDGVFQGYFGVERDVTERRQADERIRESEARYRGIFEYADDIIYLLAPDGTFNSLSPSFERLTGWRSEEWIGKSFAPIIHPDDLPRATEVFQSVLSGQATQLFELRIARKAGGYFDSELSIVPVASSDGTTAIGIARDITEHKQAAQALEESERKFRGIVDATVDGILVADVQTHKFVIANRAICDMLGYPMDEVYRLGVEDIHPAEALADVQKTFERQLKGEMRMAQNMPVKRKDGSVFFADVSASPIVLQGHTYLLGAFHDVTERMQAEERIRDSEARYRRIFEYANDIIILLNADGTFRSISPAGERITGWKAEEWTGKPFASLIHADDLADAGAAFQKALAGESIASLRLRVATKSGEYFSADVSVTPLGRDLIMGIARDVSERQRAEAEIRTLNEELETKVQERTRQLLEAQEDLVRKEKLAVLGQVAGSVGHELRNPLGVMNNAVYFLQTVLSDADETTREYLDIIKDEIAGSERIVSDLLDSVRTKPPRPEAVGVAELIGQTLNKLTIPATVTVKLDIPQTLSPLQVDAQQIHQVLRNLISNGMEAMPEGGELEIRAVENEPEGQLVISVRDTGSGIAPQDMARLFQPLFTTKERGIGLGLVVVKNLTQANGGEIAVQSEVGQGTTFTVTLPATRSFVEEG
jgi:PAS domain S-box-containing protein